MKMVVRQNKPTEISICDYCEGGIEEKERVVIEGFGPESIRNAFDLHRNCVIAFATRIQNEFEKL
jgi:hypothetical protein